MNFLIAMSILFSWFVVMFIGYKLAGGIGILLATILIVLIYKD
jgi:hypothetical protein